MNDSLAQESLEVPKAFIIMKRLFDGTDYHDGEKLDVLVVDPQFSVNGTIPVSIALEELVCQNTFRRGRQSECCWLVYLDDYKLKIRNNEIRLEIDAISVDKDYHELIDLAKGLPSLMVDGEIKSLMSKLNVPDEELSLSQAIQQLAEASTQGSDNNGGSMAVDNDESEGNDHNSSAQNEASQRLPVCRSVGDEQGSQPILHLRSITLRQLLIPDSEAAILDNVPEESLSSFEDHAQERPDSQSKDPTQSSHDQSGENFSNSGYSHPSMGIEIVSSDERAEISEEAVEPPPPPLPQSSIEAIGAIWNRSAEQMLMTDDESQSPKSDSRKECISEGTQQSEEYNTAPESIGMVEEEVGTAMTDSSIASAFREIQNVPQSTQVPRNVDDGKITALNLKQLTFSRWYPKIEINDEFRIMKAAISSWMKN